MCFFSFSLFLCFSFLFSFLFSSLSYPFPFPFVTSPFTFTFIFYFTFHFSLSLSFSLFSFFFFSRFSFLFSFLLSPFSFLLSPFSFPFSLPLFFTFLLSLLNPVHFSFLRSLHSIFSSPYPPCLSLTFPFLKPPPLPSFPPSSLSSSPSPYPPPPLPLPQNRICDECNYGTGQGRCVICGGSGISDAYYCRECTVQEKDRDGCPKIVNLGKWKGGRGKGEEVWLLVLGVGGGSVDVTGFWVLILVANIDQNFFKITN